MVNINGIVVCKNDCTYISIKLACAGYGVNGYQSALGQQVQMYTSSDGKIFKEILSFFPKIVCIAVNTMPLNKWQNGL